jgi:acyl-coenzyme A thioesterase 13
MDDLEQLKLLIGKQLNSSPSPFMRWLNPTVLSVEKGQLEFEYEIRPEWLNPMGRLHGGVTSAIIDDLIGATMLTLNEPFFYTTINNVIDYFATAKEGEKIVAETTIVKKGSQIVNAQCEIWNNKKTRLIAKGYSNLFKTHLKH